MVMVIVAMPLTQMDIWVIDDLGNGNIVERKKLWKEEFNETIQRMYLAYHVNNIQLFGPFSYIDKIAYEIQEILPYDDYEITVNINDEVSRENPEVEFLTKQQNQDMLVEQIKKENELIGLDGRPLSSQNKSGLLGV